MNKVFFLSMIAAVFCTSTQAAVVKQVNKQKKQLVIELTSTEKQMLSKGQTITIKRAKKTYSGEVVAIKRSRAIVMTSDAKRFKNKQKVVLLAQVGETDEFGYPVENEEVESSSSFSEMLNFTTTPLSPSKDHLFASFEPTTAVQSLRGSSSGVWASLKQSESKLKFDNSMASSTSKLESMGIAAHGFHTLSNGLRVGGRIEKTDGKIKFLGESLNNNKQTLGVFVAAAINDQVGVGLELVQITREVGKASSSFQRALPSVMGVVAGNELTASWQPPLRAEESNGLVTEPGFFKVAGRHPMSSELEVTGEVRQNLFKGIDSDLKNSFGLSAGYYLTLDSKMVTFGSLAYDQTAYDESGSFVHPEAVGGLELKLGGQYQLEPQHQLEANVGVKQGSASVQGAKAELTGVDLAVGYNYSF